MYTVLAVNARFLTQKVTGTQRFAGNIARELKRLQPETIFLIPPAIDNQQLATELGAKIIGIRSYRIYQRLNLPANLLWEQLNLPLYLLRHGSPILLNLVNLAPYFYKNNILTIHDLAFKLFPKYFSKKFAALYNLLIPRLAQRAQHIITVSQHSKTDICKHLKIPPNKVTVAYNAVNLEQVPNCSSPYPWPYILAVGALDPRKNIPRLIAAFLQLADKNLRLIIVGKSDPQVFNKVPNLEITDEQQSKMKRVIFTGYLENQELADLYTHAVCFCYPSLYEGFGLPPLEAQAYGCPVIVSNRSSLPEVFGNSALYCNPENIHDITKNLQSLTTDKNLRAKLSIAGHQNVLRFNWYTSTKKIYSFINSGKFFASKPRF